MAENIRNPAAVDRRLPPRPAHENTHDPAGLDSGHFIQGERFGTFRTRGTRTWLLFYTLAGAGYCRGADGRNIVTVQSEIVLWEPRIYHEYGNIRGGARWDFHWVHFDPRPAWAGGWLSLPRVPGIPGLRRVTIASVASRRRVAGAFAELHRDVRLGGAWRTEAAMNALERVLIAAHETQRAAGRGGPLDPRVEAALERIATRPGDPLTVPALAREANLSPSRFAHLFRAQTGQSVIETVLSARMREASKLLAMTPTSIKEIADALGFSSQFHFSLMFKKRFGRSPRAWRARSARS